MGTEDPDLTARKNPDHTAKVGWIYNIKKEDLVELAKQLGLSPEGTLTEIRQNLSEHFRSGSEKKPDSGNNSDNVPGTSTSKTENAQICDTARKWGIRFDGSTDPLSFLERIEELIECYRMEEDHLLRALPELLKGQVLLWYRNNKGTWRTWNDFTTDLKHAYLSPRFFIKLEDEIRNRTQGYGEKFTEYATALQTLMRRHGKFSPDQILERIYCNLRPEYRLYIRRRDFERLSDLITVANEFEELETANNTFLAPPTVTQSLVQETAFRRAPLHNTSRMENINRPSPSQARSSSEQKDNTNTNINVYDRTKTCWRCGKTGHNRKSCMAPAKLFCSYCGKDGILSRDCNCHSGNGSGRRNR